MLYKGTQHELQNGLECLRERLFKLGANGTQVHNYTFYMRNISEGEYGSYADYHDPDHKPAVDTFYNIMAVIQPPMTTLNPEFWDTAEGKLMATVQYWVHAQNNLLTVSQASLVLYKRVDNTGISAVSRLIERGKIKTIPNPEITTVNRNRFVLVDSLQKYMTERS